MREQEGRGRRRGGEGVEEGEEDRVDGEGHEATKEEKEVQGRGVEGHGMWYSMVVVFIFH